MWLLTLALPLTRLIGKIHMPYSHKHMDAGEFYALKSKLKPGIILVSKTNGDLSNCFIPGFWGHAAIAEDNNSVIEAVSEGVRRVDILDFAMTKDFVAALRPKFTTEDEMSQSVTVAKLAIGRPYDFLVEPAHDAFTCSELTAYCIEEGMRPRPSPFVKKTTLGVETVIPQDFWDASDKFEVVWTNYKG
jgi:uncharacterized protein YycO